MKKLDTVFDNKLRIIEFSKERSFLTNYFEKSNNYLSIIANEIEIDSTAIVLRGKSFINAIEKNSADIIILNCASWSELRSIQKTLIAKSFFVRITILNVLSIIYFLIKGLLSRRYKFHGLFVNKRGISFSFYAGIKKRRKTKNITRHYLSPHVSLTEFFQKLNEKKVSYCILRWFENLPKLDNNEDVDLLVEDNDLTKVYSIIDKKPGIIPFDIYSLTGIPGSDFKNLPYYVHTLAEKVLREVIFYKNVYKIPTWENYFYLLAYHVVFHKGEDSGLQSSRYKFLSGIKPDHDYLAHLRRISTKAGIVISEITLENLHRYLETLGFVPPLDTQYKLSLQNQYLKAYLEDVKHQSDLLKTFEGLVCFVIREKIIEKGLLRDVEGFIEKEGFKIVRSIKIDELVKEKFTKQVRGGNWNQGPWPTNAGKPSVLIVAFDVYPIEPETSDHLQHPGLTNKRILNKNEIRNFLNEKLPEKKEWCNGIHSSDNEIQAVEYLTLAGLKKDDIYQDIVKYKKDFKSKYPVLKILSSFSRRAKVELISYKDKKAILKTFKPGCEWFLKNEIEAYTALKDLEEVPRLLETGDNYIVISYIEGSKELGNRISLKTLKRCLKLLREIYERGYSLFDFKPANFLVAKNKKIYIIDFEFLHKYEIAPPFLECYDLVGAPNDFDFSYRPIIKIPKGKKQFDVKWGSFTGVHYDELSKLNSLSVYFKSLYRFYKLKAKKLKRLLRGRSIQGIKIIYRSLP